MSKQPVPERVLVSGPLARFADGFRVDLIERGYSRRILVSHDVCTKFQLREYGGYGFTFVQSVLIPHLLGRGVSTRAITEITVENPRRVLTFVKPQALAAR